MSKVRADNYTNRQGTGAPTFINGVNVSGIVTATSFAGDGSNLTGVVGSSQTYTFSILFS